MIVEQQEGNPLGFTIQVDYRVPDDRMSLNEVMAWLRGQGGSVYDILRHGLYQDCIMLYFYDATTAMLFKLRYVGV